MIDEAEVREALATVDDPEVGMNIVDLGLVYGIDVTPERIGVKMTMTSPSCPLGESIVVQAERAIRRVAPTMESIDVELVWEPVWTPERMSERARAFFGWAR